MKLNDIPISKVVLFLIESLFINKNNTSGKMIKADEYLVKKANKKSGNANKKNFEFLLIPKTTKYIFQIEKEMLGKSDKPVEMKVKTIGIVEYKIQPKKHSKELNLNFKSKYNPTILKMNKIASIMNITVSEIKPIRKTIEVKNGNNGGLSKSEYPTPIPANSKALRRKS